MRSYRGDLIAIALIVAGALGSYGLYQHLGWSHTETVVAPPVGPRGLILQGALPGPARGPASKLRVPGGWVLHFRTVEPERKVYLVRPGRPDLRVRSGTDILLGDARAFDGVFHTHGLMRKVHIEVELFHDGAVTQTATVSALHPHVDVTRGQLGVFDLF